MEFSTPLLLSWKPFDKIKNPALNRNILHTYKNNEIVGRIAAIINELR
jgi:hypothetical protein